MATSALFHYEVENSGDDEHHNKLTSVKCHGKLVAENADELKDLVKPLIPLGGRIVIDLGDLNYLDSSGLGTLLGLKISAVKQGYCILEIANMTPKVLELLKMTNLASIFSS
jgi:anti-anti-sigma factor